MPRTIFKRASWFALPARGVPAQSQACVQTNHFKTALAGRSRLGRPHTTDTYLSAQYRRLAARRGREKATFAVGHSSLVSAYHILRTHAPYADLGSTSFDERERISVERCLIRRLERLGLKVSVEPLLPVTGVA